MFHADGRTNTTKVIVAFRNFANALKNVDSVFLPKSVKSLSDLTVSYSPLSDLIKCGPYSQWFRSCTQCYVLGQCRMLKSLFSQMSLQTAVVDGVTQCVHSLLPSISSSDKTSRGSQTSSYMHLK